MSGKKTDYSIKPVSFYKFVCKNSEILFSYVGHTINFIKRKSAHKSSCNNIQYKDHNTPLYVFMRKNGGFENWNMIVIHTQICKDKRDAERIETELQEQQQFKLNVMKAYVSEEQQKEQLVKYLEKNKEQISIKNAIRGVKYRDQNKEQLALRGIKYRDQNKEYIADYKAEWYQENRDIISAKNKARYALKKAQMLCEILDVTNQDED